MNLPKLREETLVNGALRALRNEQTAWLWSQQFSESVLIPSISKQEVHLCLLICDVGKGRSSHFLIDSSRENCNTNTHVIHLTF
jgi:hypothetical protein